MGETEEKKGQMKVAAPISLADAYNADTPEGAALRSIYDFKDNTLVPKTEEQDNNDMLNAAIEPLNQEAKSYNDMITKWQGDREKYEAQMNQRIERKQEASKWGSIIEAASALTNLIGTTQGANFIPVEQKSQGWQNQADALVRERDAKLDNYRSQMSTLKKMKQDIEMKKATVISAYNTQKETTARANARMASTAATAISKAAISANTQFAKNKETAFAKVQSNATRMLTSILRDETSMGRTPTASSVEKWADLTFKIALEQYKSENPGDFDGTSVPTGNVSFDSI